jgi:protein-S-isoprenylcysteine O-methyltransferase Ste14
VIVASVLFIAWLFVSGLDAVRYGWSNVPAWLRGVGLLILFGSFYLFFATFRENSFLSPVARYQEERGQTVITTGPYHVVRHPMYAAAMLLFVGGSLLLGSYYGILVGLLLTIAVGWRARREETVLRQELSGYTDYMSQVKYRLIPGIW